MKTHRSAAAALLIAGSLAGGFGLPGSPAQAAGFSARFSWAGIPACSTVSPAFTVSQVPAGTTALAFVMHDEQAPAFHHGGSTVPYAGAGKIPRGAVAYVGPCPPAGETHRYVWTIEARDGSRRTLGTTTAAARFPP